MRLFRRRREVPEAAPEPARSSGSSRFLARFRSSPPAAPEPWPDVPPPARPTLLLPSHVAVRVNVVRAGDLAPVPAVDVAVHPTTDWGRATKHRPLPAPATTTTDASGVARFLLPVGEYAVVVREEDWETRHPLVVTGRMEATLEIGRPPAGGREPMTVRVERHGRPVPHVRIRLLEGPSAPRESTADEDGGALLWLRPGTYKLACEGETAVVEHRGASLVVFALARHGPAIPDAAWHLAEPEEFPFGVAEGPPASGVLRDLRPLHPPTDLGRTAGERWVEGPSEGTATARVRVA